MGGAMGEVLPHLRRDLTIGHLVDGFDLDDASATWVLLEAVLQLDFGLARPEDENGVCGTNARNHRIVVSRELRSEPSLLAIVRGHLL
jgi:hypothetical protein